MDTFHTIPLNKTPISDFYRAASGSSDVSDEHHAACKALLAKENYFGHKRLIKSQNGGEGIKEDILGLGVALLDRMDSGERNHHLSELIWSVRSHEADGHRPRFFMTRDECCEEDRKAIFINPNTKALFLDAAKPELAAVYGPLAVFYTSEPGTEDKLLWGHLVSFKPDPLHKYLSSPSYYTIPWVGAKVFGAIMSLYRLIRNKRGCPNNGWAVHYMGSPCYDFLPLLNELYERWDLGAMIMPVEKSRSSPSRVPDKPVVKKQKVAGV